MEIAADGVMESDVDCHMWKLWYGPELVVESTRGTGHTCISSVEVDGELCGGVVDAKLVDASKLASLAL